jgi:pyruvate dehydrogenase E1 component alpha subunit
MGWYFVDRASAVKEIRQKAEGYQIPNSRIDGMDVLEVRKSAEKILKQVRSGKGPYFLEIVTYRYRGHSMGDPERYRSPEEVKKRQENDPIGIYRQRLLTQDLAVEKDSNKLSARAQLIRRQP